MLAFCAGDGSAFDSLFDRWAGPLLHYLERMVVDSGTAEELVQEGFLRVYRAKDRYRPEAKFSTWLYRIGTNLALNESLRSLTPSAMPADLRARLQTRIEGDSEDATQPISSETSMGWGKPLAAALAAGLIAAWLLLPASNPDVAQVAIETLAERASETVTEEFTEPVTEVAESNTVHDAGRRTYGSS